MDFDSLKTKLQKKYTTTFQDQFSQEIWESTYKDHNDKTVDDTMFRVAHALASVEDTDEKKVEWTEKFYDLLSNFKATAGGRIYANAGTEWKGTTFINCFVAPRANHDIDSLSNIIDTLKAQSLTLKSEGGWGENFSWIRPRGAFIHGIGVETPGAVKYMELFDKSSDIITAGSGKKSSNSKAKGKIRKGAMMAVLDVWHPDVIEFITAKQTSGRLTKFNMSVNCSDEFMFKVIRVMEIDNELFREQAFDEHNIEYIEKLKSEKEELDKWNLRYPDTTHPKYKKEWRGDIKKWDEVGYPTVIYQTVSATWLWNLIMESTYNRAEPGVLFLDRANYFNPLNYAETIYATNPCITGDTLIATADGRNAVSIKQLADEGKDIPVYSINTNTGEMEVKIGFNPRRTGIMSKVFKVVLDDGSFFKATHNHKVLLCDLTYKEIKDLTKNDLIFPFGSNDVTGLGHRYVLNRNSLSSRTIQSIDFIGHEDVYNITVDDNHNYHIITSTKDDKFITSSGICIKNCGEQTLAPGGICCLSSLNLTQFLNDDKTDFDYKRIAKYAGYLVRFLDNVNTLSNAPLPEYEETMKNKRRIGIGILGWASALFMMKVRFGSEKSHELRDNVMSTIARSAYMYSIDLAEEKGMFKFCKPELHSQNPFVVSLDLPKSYMEKLRTTGIRNSSLLSIQPTGNCQTPDTIIKTKEYGNFSYENILKEQFGKDFDVTKLVDGQVLNLKTPITIKTYEGDEVVNSIFINGYSDIIKLTLNNGDILKQTKNHRYLVKISETTAKWVESKDLAIGMKILGVI